MDVSWTTLIAANMGLRCKRLMRKRTSIVAIGLFGFLSLTSAWVTSPVAVITQYRRTMRHLVEKDIRDRKTPPTARPMFGQALHRNHTISSVSTSVSRKSVSSPRARQINSRRSTDEVRSDSSIMSLHKERMQNAGRVGTKRFVNPCKVFIGNISFQVQSAQELRTWVIQQMGLPEHVLLKDCQLVTEWKTGKSKGYGFVLFTEPIYATMAITKLNGMRWHDRPLSVLQGIQQKTLQELSLRRERASLERNAKPSVQKEEPSIIYMDAQEAAMLRKLDPDLLEGVRIVSERPTHPTTLPDPTLDLSVDDEEEDYDDSDEGVDGVWYGDDVDGDEEVTSSKSQSVEEEAMNRQQRRDAAKGKKKVKRPRKGFGV